ncbi:hypothetical protein WA538_001109 [Blastocystis sp. DL]
MNDSSNQDRAIAEKLRGKNFLDAEPLSNAEVVLLLNDRARELSKVHATVPQMIRDTLRDCTAAVNSGPELPSNSVKSKKDKLMSFIFEGENGPLKLDAAEVCQIMNLHPETEDDLISYLPTLKRFSEYHLSLFIEE